MYHYISSIIISIIMTNTVSQPRYQLQFHPFCLVEASPWPILTANAALSMTIGAVFYFNGIQHGSTLATLGFSSTLILLLWDVSEVVTLLHTSRASTLEVHASNPMSVFLLNTYCQVNQQFHTQTTIKIPQTLKIL
ncbi:MAG: hypothetical protein EOP45_00320 [Sphingobacteriaceae bacterium]|nr:MAG: hypothetical protein EOP45_00320 [Sphingobacteriaceae bacterium]